MCGSENCAARSADCAALSADRANPQIAPDIHLQVTGSESVNKLLEIDASVIR